MKLLPDDPRTRRELRIGALVAGMVLLAAMLLDPFLAMAVFPGLWVVLRARPSHCAQAPVRPGGPH